MAFASQILDERIHPAFLLKVAWAKSCAIEVAEVWWFVWQPWIARGEGPFDIDRPFHRRLLISGKLLGLYRPGRFQRCHQLAPNGNRLASPRNYAMDDHAPGWNSRNEVTARTCRGRWQGALARRVCKLWVIKRRPNTKNQDQRAAYLRLSLNLIFSINGMILPRSSTRAETASIARMVSP